MRLATEGTENTEIGRFPCPCGFSQIFVWFASLDDLIAMKKAAGRPKDKEDLEFLRRLRQRKTSGAN